ncbi:MAG: fibronectin type III domain-containing protein [Saprospirales bacterium]|nr:fibronectin type III domain-containing protein [Saprospirales bacterium]
MADGYADYLTVEELTAGELTLGWEFPDSLETEIQGFDIYRAKEQEGKLREN